MSISNKIIKQVLIVVITGSPGSPAFQMQSEPTACGNANCKHIKVILLAIRTFMRINNTFFCIIYDVILLAYGEILQKSIFNILIGQKRDMTEVKLVWTVNMTVQRSKIILSPAVEQSNS